MQVLDNERRSGRPTWVDTMALMLLAAIVVVGATFGLVRWLRPDLASSPPGAVETAEEPPVATAPTSAAPTSTIGSLEGFSTMPPAAVPRTPTEQEFKDRWDTLPSSQRTSVCAAVALNGVTAAATTMDSAAPGLVPFEFIVAVLNEKCDGTTAPTRPAPTAPPATAPPVSLDIDWGGNDVSLCEQMDACKGG